MVTFLCTSRHAVSLGRKVPITDMTEEEVVELLLRQSKAERTNDSARIGETVVHLGYLPLACDQASPDISIRNLPLDLFLTHCEQP
jgi:hypothetical protein